MHVSSAKSEDKIIYIRVGCKYIYMVLSFKYTENDQVQVQTFFKYTVVHYKYIWH